jgi:uncharacterized protein YbdZ (MbtH family)
MVNSAIGDIPEGWRVGTYRTSKKLPLPHVQDESPAAPRPSHQLSQAQSSANEEIPDW